MANPKFISGKQSFHLELKKRINDYFETTGKSLTGNSVLYTKAIVLLTAFLVFYIHLVFFTPAVIFSIIECIVLGFIVAGIGFNIMHDGAHGSFSKYKWLNSTAAFSLNILGGSSFMWNVKHNVIHHAYTNIDGVDDDIDIQPWLRLATLRKKERCTVISIFISGYYILYYIYFGYLFWIILNISEVRSVVQLLKRWLYQIISCSGRLKFCF